MPKRKAALAIAPDPTRERKALLAYVRKVALGMSRGQQFGGKDECIEADEVRQVLYLRARHDKRLEAALKANGGSFKVVPLVLDQMAWSEDADGLWWPPKGAA